MNIYEIKEGYLGDQISILEDEAIPLSWTTDAPPTLDVDEYAMWVGRWIITSIPPMPPEPMYDPNTQVLQWDGITWLINTKDNI